MLTDRLFCENLEEAIDEVAKANGGRKKTAQEIWPSLAPREAHNRMDACLNPERREKFDPSEITWFVKKGREVGCHSIMRHFAQEGSYAEPVPVDPESEKDSINRDLIQTGKTVKRLLDRLEKLEQGAKLRSA